MESIYDTLMSLPLINGVSPDRLNKIVSSTPLHFLKYLDGQTVIEAGESMTHLSFLINGSVRVTTSNETGRFSVGYTLSAPDVLVPDFLFGRSTCSPSTVKAIDTAGLIKIAKADYVAMLRSDKVLLFNYLNLLSAAAQTRIDGILSLTDGLLEERIAFWIVALTQHSSRDILLSSRQRDLSAFFGVQRSAFTACIDSLVERGIITVSKDGIHPTSREALVSLLVNSNQD